LVDKVESKIEGVEIVIISAKPSLSRWPLKKKYEELNGDFKKYCDSKNNMSFADVWTPMLDNTGKPKKDIFVKDGLHMNSAGYDIWAEVLKDFVN